MSTPLSELRVVWPGNPAAGLGPLPEPILKHLEANYIKTIEQLAGVADSNAKAVPMFNCLRTAAREHLERAATVDVNDLRLRVLDLEVRVQALEEKKKP